MIKLRVEVLSVYVAVLSLLAGCCQFNRSAEPAANAVIEGAVTDMDGSPMIGIVVYERWSKAQATTDGTGRYRFDDVKPGERKLDVTGQWWPPKSEYAVWPAGYRSIDCVAGLTYVCDLTVRKCGHVEVSFVGDTNRFAPPGVVTMDLLDRRYWNRYKRRGRVGKARVKLLRVPAGIYDATFTGSGMMPYLKEIEVPAAGRVLVNIPLQEPRALVGVVQDREGVPLENVRVRLQGDLKTGVRPAEFVSDSGGRFCVTKLSDGKVKLLFDYRGFLSTNTVAAVPQSNVVSIAMRRGTDVSGVVTLADGTPAANVMVSARDPNWRGNVNVRDLTKVRNNGSLSWMTRANDRGEFLLTGFPEGRYDLTAGFGLSKGRHGYGADECSVVRGIVAGTSDVNISLPRFITRVHMLAGSPVGRIDVEGGASLRWLRDQRWVGLNNGQGNHERIHAEADGRESVVHSDATSEVNVLLGEPIACEQGDRYRLDFRFRTTKKPPRLKFCGYSLRAGVPSSVGVPPMENLVDCYYSSDPELVGAASNGWQRAVAHFPRDKKHKIFRHSLPDVRFIGAYMRHADGGEVWIADASVKKLD